MQMTNIYAAFHKPNKNRTYYATYERTSAQKNLRTCTHARYL